MGIDTSIIHGPGKLWAVPIQQMGDGRWIYAWLGDSEIRRYYNDARFEQQIRAEAVYWGTYKLAGGTDPAPIEVSIGPYPEQPSCAQVEQAK